MASKKYLKTLKSIPQNPNEILPLLLFPAQSKAEEAWLTKLKKEKKIRKIGPRLYTSVAKAQEKAVVRSQWTQIVSRLYPEVLLSHRSALEYKPSSENKIILTSSTNRQVVYPGLTLHFLRGPKAQREDLPFAGFRVSSIARAYLENFSTTKVTSWQSLSRTELENKLESLLQVKGEKSLNEIRDAARKISQKLTWEKEFKKFDQLIGALLGTRSNQALESSGAKARSRQRPFDLERVSRFDLLFASLKSTPLAEFKEKFEGPNQFRNKAFFEAYFSNYIEGTAFEIEEAEEIIFDGKIPVDRPKDAHDILGTFNIVSDSNEMKRRPKSFSELEDLIKKRHYTLMHNRPEVLPGKYKDKPNRAGDTHFVNPENIQGTLEQGFQRYVDLPEGLARAIFIMFLISEVHPFGDGNGRICRIMMNAELYGTKNSTIIIPNVYRDDYISALRALTRRDRPDPLIKMIARAHKFSNLDFSIYKSTLKEIEVKNWFREPTEAKLIE